MGNKSSTTSNVSNVNDSNNIRNLYYCEFKSDSNYVISLPINKIQIIHHTKFIYFDIPNI